MKKKIEIKTPQDKLKYEVARELGLIEKIEELGWGGLTAKETGKVGGMMTVRKKKGILENKVAKKDNVNNVVEDSNKLY